MRLSLRMSRQFTFRISDRSSRRSRCQTPYKNYTVSDTSNRTPAPAVTVVALGDSTTAGTPGFRSPLEAPPDGAGNAESQYGYWLGQTHPDWQILNCGVNGERSDEIRS